MNSYCITMHIMPCGRFIGA